MIPVQALPLKQDVGNDSKDDERDALLYYLQLYQRERTAVPFEADAVGRYLTAILKKGDAPREGDNGNERPVAAGARLL